MAATLRSEQCAQHRVLRRFAISAFKMPSATTRSFTTGLLLLMCGFALPWNDAKSETAATHLANPAQETTHRPQRVVSLSLCLDELVLALAEREQIAAVSRLATDARYSRLWRQAAALPTHSGLAEQIVALKPDLIMGADYEQGKAVQLLRQLGFTVQTFSSPQSLAEIPAHVRAVATLLGAEARAEALLQTLASELANAAAQVHGKPQLLALSLAPNGYTAGRRSLKNELFHLTGYRTVADQLQQDFDYELKLEVLLQQQPDRIFLEEQQGDQNALAHRLLQHPALRALPDTSQRIAFPSAEWLCPGLGVGAAARTLAEAH